MGMIFPPPEICLDCGEKIPWKTTGGNGSVGSPTQFVLDLDQHKCGKPVNQKMIEQGRSSFLAQFPTLRINLGQSIRTVPIPPPEYAI